LGFLIWLEASSLGEWVRTSLTGYPLMITCHAVGMAVMVGLAVALDMRVLGWFQGIPHAALQRFLGIAWIGFAINFLSGTALFTTQATTYITDVTFLLKMGFVFAGVTATVLLQVAIGRDFADGSRGLASGGARVIAVVSIICWVAATVTGRLIAYL
jgi:hypothetical protein